MSEEFLTRYLNDLRSRNDDVRAQSANDLKVAMARLVREMPSEAFAKLVAELNRRIIELVSSADVHEKMGGVSLIRELLTVSEMEEREARLIRFANHLRLIFQQSGMSEPEQRLIREAASVLGDLVEQGGVLAADTVEFEIKRSLEWLEVDRSDQRRFCAVCVLKQLAQRTPTLFNVHASNFLDRVWLTLRDPKIVIREASAEALRACLVLVAKRSMRLQDTYKAIYQEIFASVRSGGTENLHAALLALSQLLQNSVGYLQQRFKECCELVLRYREHKERYIRDTVITIIPQLASFSPTAFTRSYAREALSYLVVSLRSGSSSRDVTFIALGNLSLTIKDAILPEIDNILQLIREGLTARSRKAFCVEALGCMACICKSVGTRSARVNASLSDLVDQMFSAGLSAALINALREVCQAMPQVLPAVQERILTGLGVIFASGHQQNPKDKADSSRRTLSFSFGSSFSFPLFSPSSNDKGADPASSTELLYLALTTLGTFDFYPHNLLVFVRDAVLPFLDDERPRIRKRAAMSAATILIQTTQQLAILESETDSTETADAFLSDSELEESQQTREVSVGEIRERHLVTRLWATLDRRSSPHVTSPNGLAPVSSHSSLQRVTSIQSKLPHLLRASSAHSSPKHTPKNASESSASNGTSTFRSPGIDSAAYHVTNAHLVVEIVERLLTVAVCDPDPTIRKTVIDSLNRDSRFDRWFADQELIDALFLTLQDEVFVNREAAIHLIGRLAMQLPPFVMPSMRKTVTQFLSELEYTGDQRRKEESALLLGALVRSSQHLMRPYVSPILLALTNRLKSVDAAVPGVLTSCLSTLGDLATIVVDQLESQFDELTPLIVTAIEDRSSQVPKEVALRCLSAVASSAGLVVEPWSRFPHLLPTLLSLLRAGVSWPVRREIFKLIGVLGAIDPLKFKNILLSAGIEARGDEELTQVVNDPFQLPASGAAAPSHNHPTKSDAQHGADDTNVDDLHHSSLPSTIQLTQPHSILFPTISLKALLSVLREPSLSSHHVKAVQALSKVVKSMTASNLLHFLPIILPNVVSVIRSCGDESVIEQLFTQVQSILLLIRQHVRPYLPLLTQLALDFLNNPQAKMDLTFALIERLSQIMRDEWRIHLPPLLPALLSLLHSDRTPSRVAVIKVLHALEVFGDSIMDYLHLIVPALVRLVEQPDVPITSRIAALRTLSTFSRSMDLSDFAGRIIHPIARILEQAESNRIAPTPRNTVPPLISNTARDEVLICLCILVFQLDSAYLIFVPMISKVLLKQNIRFSVYDNLVAKIVAHQPLTISDISPLRSVLGRVLNVENDTVSPLSSHLAVQSSDFHFLSPPDGESGLVDMSLSSSDQRETKRFSINFVALKKAWEVNQRSTGDDWHDWFRGLSIELLKESPASSLRACATLASKHHTLARDLFQAAFSSCWVELSDAYQDDLVRCLEIALNSISIPSELIQVLLNLAEFMERDGRPLPIDPSKFCQLAENVHAYAKALYYKEQEFLLSPQSALDGLIGLHNELKQTEATAGALALAKSRSLAIQVKESWLEKLQRWEEALEGYDVKALERADDAVETENELQPSLILGGRMRCLKALGEWERLYVVSSSAFHSCSEDAQKRDIAPMASYAAWMCSKWEEMKEYVSAMSESRFETDFYQAVLAVHNQQFEQVELYVERGRELLDGELAALVGESYDRAYGMLVQCQQLTELEEIVRLRKAQDCDYHSLRTKTSAIWSRRLLGCSHNVDVWSALLSVRSLLQSAEDDVITQIKYSSLCRKSNRISAALRVFHTLLPEQDIKTESSQVAVPVTLKYPAVSFAYLKHLWHAGQHETAFFRLYHYLDALNQLKCRPEHDNHTDTGEQHALLDFELQSSVGSVNSFTQLSNQELNILRARAYVKVGEWQLALDGDTINKDNINSVLNSFRIATQYAPNSYKSWHQYAVMNYRCVTHYQMLKQRVLSGDDKIINQLDYEQEQTVQLETNRLLFESRIHELDLKIRSHVVPAIKGFFRSISLAGTRGLQDILRLLTLWFAHGTSHEVEVALNEGFNSISIDTWLPVIPQIIARINSSHSGIRRMIQSLLCQLGCAHPQALVYPLAVVLKSGTHRNIPNTSARDFGASVVMADMRSHSRSLVDEAMLVSKELIRVSILWHELWHEALEEASRVWFGQRNIDLMIATLEPLQLLMSRGPSNLREVGFLHAFGRDLLEAHEWTQRFLKSGYETDISAAWDLYCLVFRRVNKQMSAMTELELQYVSPHLLQVRDLQLAMPGTYLADRDATDKKHVTIKYFARTLRVIESKQRPRKLAIIGSDGQEYSFLLKGHEDLRQDKRVMQLFGLVNGFLSSQSYSTQAYYNEDLSIKGYSVIPLSQESGLIQWLHACDTMHALVKEYRDTNKVLMNLEHRFMLSMMTRAEDLALLSLMHKVEVFESSLSKTSGSDLARVLWLQSINSERWLERRGCFTRSLAVMSMVGYVLGLGDRHPCNLMISQRSGKVIHVDFGDCFEVAQTREKFPERIPFRLTRMLIAAMELSGIEGTYRTVCERVMHVLRENKESVMAVLEAFVHDPLLGWRLLKPATTVFSAIAGAPQVPSSVSPSQLDDEGEDLSDDEDSQEMDDDDASQPSNEQGPTLRRVHSDLTEDAIEERPHPPLAPTAFISISFVDNQETDAVHMELNAKALSVLARVESKLVGRDFDSSQALDVESQVHFLIQEATSSLNLCRLYLGWLAYI